MTAVHEDAGRQGPLRTRLTPFRTMAEYAEMGIWHCEGARRQSRWSRGHHQPHAGAGTQEIRPDRLKSGVRPSLAFQGDLCHNARYAVPHLTSRGVGRALSHIFV